MHRTLFHWYAYSNPFIDRLPSQLDATCSGWYIISRVTTYRSFYFQFYYNSAYFDIFTRQNASGERSIEKIEASRGCRGLNDNESANDVTRRTISPDKSTRPTPSRRFSVCRESLLRDYSHDGRLFSRGTAENPIRSGSPSVVRRARHCCSNFERIKSTCRWEKERRTCTCRSERLYLWLLCESSASRNDPACSSRCTCTRRGRCCCRRDAAPACRSATLPDVCWLVISDRLWERQSVVTYITFAFGWRERKYGWREKKIFMIVR